MKEPMDVLREFPVRKSRRRKQLFLDAVIPYINSMGYEARIEPGIFRCRNLVAGDPETADFLITAHYDTCSRLPVPNLITPCSLTGNILYQLGVSILFLGASLIPALLVSLWNPGLFSLAWLLGAWTMLAFVLWGPANQHCANDNTSGVVTLLEIMRGLPENRKPKVCFVLFDLEEAGLWGSYSYAKAHRTAVSRQLSLNLDCVGDGNHILFFPTKQLRREPEKMRILSHCEGTYGPRSISIRRSGFSFCPSDQMHFPYGVGICALHRRGKTLYLSGIHTSRDRVLNPTNVNLLRTAILSMISCGAVK